MSEQDVQKNNESTVTVDNKDFVSAVLSVRATAIQMLANEANGIWQRLNFFVVMHFSALTAYLFLFKDPKPEIAIVLVLMSVFGIYGAYSNLWALTRLWLWHNEFYDSVVRTEAELPDGFPKPFTRTRELQSVNKESAKIQRPFNFLTLNLLKFMKILGVAEDAKNMNKPATKGLFVRLSEGRMQIFMRRTTNQIISLILVVWMMLFVLSCYELWIRSVQSEHLQIGFSMHF